MRMPDRGAANPPPEQWAPSQTLTVSGCLIATVGFIGLYVIAFVLGVILRWFA